MCMHTYGLDVGRRHELSDIKDESRDYTFESIFLKSELSDIRDCFWEL